MLAEEWRRETGNEARWCWPSHLGLPPALGTAPVRKIPACDTPGAALWLSLCDSLARGETPLLVRLGHSILGLPQLRQVEQLFTKSDAVFGITALGDYALVGLARAVPEFFAGIPWGTNQVMSVTRAQARRYGCKIGELALDS
ncbi:MAG: hypothetical protein JWN73_4824 [Betaproteobacteria bacterium]|nr:hypothetical protein [Betaproteobacteria bacterium]